MVFVYGVLLFMVSPFLFSWTPASNELLKIQYDVIKNGKVIGYMTSSMVEKDGVIQYTTESNVKVSMLITIRVYNKVQASFWKGFLQDGSLMRKVNSKSRADTRIRWNSTAYQVDENGSSSTFGSRISFSTACLMHVEPVNKQYIFSENFLRFVPVKEVAPHKYELVLPDGHSNFYTYENGRCVEVEVITSFATIYIRPKK